MYSLLHLSTRSVPLVHTAEMKLFALPLFVLGTFVMSSLATQISSAARKFPYSRSGGGFMSLAPGGCSTMATLLPLLSSNASTWSMVPSQGKYPWQEGFTAQKQSVVNSMNAMRLYSPSCATKLVTTRGKIWSVLLTIASFGISDETGMTRTTFTHLKTLSIPDDIGSLFPRFDVLQIDGDYIVISGNWSSKAFLLIDWKRELMTIHRCSRYWRTFDWKMIASKLFIVYDDCQVDAVDIPPHLDPDIESPVIRDFFQVITLPEYTDIQFSYHGSNSFSVLVVTDLTDGTTAKAPIISHTQMTLDVDRPVSCRPGSFDGLAFSEGSRTSVSSSGMACKGAKEKLTVWSMKRGGSFCEVPLNIAGCPMEILDVDLEIGMIAVKEGGYGTLHTPQIKAYWIL